MTSKKDCSRAVEISLELARNTPVSPQDARFYADHIKNCPECRIEKEALDTLGRDSGPGLFDEMSDEEKKAYIDSIVFMAGGEEIEEAGTCEKGSSFLTRNKGGVPGICAAAAAVIIVLAWMGLRNQKTGDQMAAPVIATENTAEEAKTETATADDAISETVSRNVENKDGYSTIHLRDGILLSLGPLTSISVDNSEKEIDVSLIRGSILASVDPNLESVFLSISTAKGRIMVTGTVFSVSSDSRRVVVRVLKGHVRIKDRQGKPRVLKSWQSTNMGETRVRDVSEHEKEDIARQLDLIRTLTQEPEKNVETSQLSDVLMEISSDRQEMPAEEPVQNGLISGTAGSDEALTAEQLLLQAQSFRLNRQWKDAAGAYGKIIELYPDAYEAMSSMVSLAGIKLNKLNSPGEALKWYDRYLELYPGRPLMPEAVFGKANALRALGKNNMEADTLRLFINKFPDTIQAQEARKRLKRLENVPD